MALFKKNNISRDEVVNVESLNKDIERLFIVQDIIKSIGNKSTFQSIATETLNLIEKKMGYSAASISIVDLKANTIQLKYLSQSNLSRIANTMIPKNVYEPLSLAEAPITLTKKAAIEGKVIIGDDLTQFIVPPLSLNTARALQTIANIKNMIAVPIKTREGVIGVLNFSTGQKKEDISNNELKTLEYFIEQIGLIIDNALKYERISNFNIELKNEIEKATASLVQQNKDITSLYNLTSQISKSLDPDVVSQTAVDSLPQDQTMIGAILTEYVQADGSIIVKALTQNRISDAARNLLGDFQKYKTLTNDPSAVGTPTVKAILSGEPQFTDDLVSAFSPPIPKTLVTPLLRIINVKSLAVYPVISRGRIVGTIGYLMKDKSYTELEENQKQLLQTYTTQISIALENARLFTEVERVKNNLEIALSELQIARERERDMIDIMGHELRTPMSIVRNALGMMELHLKKEGSIPLDKQQKYVDAAIESAKREINLIETLLSATKADSKGFQLTLEKVDLLDVINDSLEALKSQAIKRGLEIKYQKPDKDLFVYCDRTRIQEVADNFIGNAIKYTPKGFVEISVEVKGSFGWVHVKDSGVGIDEQDLKKLGRKFFRAKQYTGDPGDPASIVRPGGTGLGLYVSFNLVRIMEGILDVQSKVGEGSIFSFAMPLFTDQKTTQVERKVAPEQTSIESLR